MKIKSRLNFPIQLSTEIVMKNLKKLLFSIKMRKCRLIEKFEYEIEQIYYSKQKKCVFIGNFDHYYTAYTEISRIAKRMLNPQIIEIDNEMTTNY